MSAMLLTEIDHVAIAVRDLEAAIDYYHRAFGAEVEHREVLESDGVEEALLKVADGIVLAPGADARAVRILGGLGGPFTLSEARRALDTTRRVAVPLLEYLDSRGHTIRVDGTLRRCRTAEERTRP